LLFSRFFLVWSPQRGGFLRSSASRGSYPVSERSARGSLSVLRAKASPLQTPASPKADGPSDKLERKKKGKKKENRAKEESKEMFLDFNKNEREHSSLIRSCI